jgi:hypothetical protein
MIDAVLNEFFFLLPSLLNFEKSIYPILCVTYLLHFTNITVDDDLQKSEFFYELVERDLSQS